jgi:hypothetical protein
MLDKILIPLEDVPFLNADNNVRLRYRLKSKDGNEVSQWSPVYTITPFNLYSGPTNIQNVDDVYINPIAYSGWNPVSYTDEDNLYIKFDSGWINDKKMIPYKNFDAFVSWNYANSIINIAPQTPTFSTPRITITTNVAHNIAVGQTIIISGVTPDGYNGTWIAKSGTTGTTLKIDVGSNPGAITVTGVVNIVEKWGYEVSNNAEIEFGSITTPSGSYTLATVSNINLSNINILDILKAKVVDYGTGTFGDVFTTTTVTGIIGTKIRISSVNTVTTSPTITSGIVGNISKFSSTQKTFGYAGSSSDNGQIIIKIPKQVYTDNNVIQYQYYLTPRTYPATLDQDASIGNWVFLSNELTTKPTFQIGSLDNTIDGGSPS